MTAAAREELAWHIPTWTFADRLRKVRTDVLDLHQAEFADRLGVTKNAYAAWESGRTQPRDLLGVAHRIEQVASVPAAWLLGIEAPSGTTNRRYPAGSHRHLTVVPPIQVVHDRTSGPGDTAVAHPRAA